jgi:hypothetical protein
MPLARELAAATGQRLRLVELSNRKDIEEILPDATGRLQ